MVTMMNGLNQDMRISNKNLIQSLKGSDRKIIEDANGFPIWDPGENSGNDVKLDDSNITVTENSLCEGVKTEYFEDSLDFTLSTLHQKSFYEDNLVLASEVRAYSQDNSSDGNHWPLRSGHHRGGEENFDLHSGLQ